MLNELEVEELITKYDCWSDVGDVKGLIEEVFQKGYDQGYEQGASDEFSNAYYSNKEIWGD